MSGEHRRLAEGEMGVNGTGLANLALYIKM
jgi:hypothetical protein